MDRQGLTRDSGAKPRGIGLPPELVNAKLQQDPRKLLAFHTNDARKILIGPEGYRNLIDEAFVANGRRIYMFYEALQNSLSRTDQQGEVSYPDLKELSRYLAIHKRSLSDRSPMPSEEEILQIAMVLAGQRTPFIHILRRIVQTSSGIDFQTSFVAPTESRPEMVVTAYKDIIHEAHSVIKRIINSDFESLYLEMSGRSIGARVQPEPRVGRLDYELRKLYLDSKRILIPEEYKTHAQRVNQELFIRIYKPIIMEGIRSQALFSFNCDDMRADTGDGPTQFYDIVHLASPPYLRKRLALLSESLNPSYFQDWWDDELESSLQRMLNMGKIDQRQYMREMAFGLFKSLGQRSDTAPPHLIHLTMELAKLAEWEGIHEKKVETEKKRLELSSLLETLQKTQNIYLLKDKDWITENKETVMTLLHSKVPGVLACTHPYLSPAQVKQHFNLLGSSVDLYLLVKDKKASANAIEAAEKLYHKNRDNTLLRVLENLFAYHTESREKLIEYIAPIHLNQFEEALNRAYLPYLPWWISIYYSLVRKSLDKSSLSKIKTKLDLTERQNLNRIASTQDSHKASSPNSGLSLENKASQRPAQRRERIQNNSEEGSPEEKALIEKSCKFLEEEWEKNSYPSRQALITMAGNSGELMKKILSELRTRGAPSSQIVSIDIHERGKIYASRAYLSRRRATLIRSLNAAIEKEETYQINDRTFLNTNYKNKFLHKGILEYLKDNPDL